MNKKYISSGSSAQTFSTTLRYIKLFSEHSSLCKRKVPRARFLAQSALPVSTQSFSWDAGRRSASQVGKFIKIFVKVWRLIQVQMNWRRLYFKMNLLCSITEKILLFQGRIFYLTFIWSLHFIICWNIIGWKHSKRLIKLKWNTENPSDWYSLGGSSQKLNWTKSPAEENKIYCVKYFLCISARRKKLITPYKQIHHIIYSWVTS